MFANQITTEGEGVTGCEGEADKKVARAATPAGRMGGGMY
jgi:hypothetical protein